MGANLSDANLGPADLNYAILTDTNLSGTSLPSGFGEDYMDHVVSGGAGSLAHPWVTHGRLSMATWSALWRKMEGANLTGGNFSAGVVLLETD